MFWRKTGNAHKVWMKASIPNHPEYDASSYHSDFLTFSGTHWVSLRGENIIGKCKESLGISKRRGKKSLFNFSHSNKRQWILFSSCAGGAKWPSLLLRGKEEGEREILSVPRRLSSFPPPDHPDHLFLLYSQGDSWLWDSVTMRWNVTLSAPEGEHLEILEQFAAHLESKSMSSSGVGKPTWQSSCGVGSLQLMHTRTTHSSMKHWKLKNQSFTRHGLISTALRHCALRHSPQKISACYECNKSMRYKCP